MKTGFPKLRIALQVAVIGGFLFLFFAFLSLAAGFDFFPNLFMFLGLCLLAILQASGSEARISKREQVRMLFPNLIGFIPITLVIWWIFSQSALGNVWERVFVRSTLWDWRLITAVSIWTAYAIVKRSRAVRAWDDEKIYDLIKGPVGSQSSESADRL